MKQTVIKEYIRNKKNNPQGIAVAVKDGDQVFYGYSLCNPGDRYNKEFGMNVAINRALSKDGYALPQSSKTVRKIIERFLSLEKRAIRYFKDIDPENIKFNAE